MQYYPREQAQTGVRSSGLLSKVFGLLAFSMVFSAVGGVIGYHFARGMILPLIILEIGLLIGLYVGRNKEGLNLALLYGFTFVSGMTLGPVVWAYNAAGLGVIVVEALVVTGAMTVGLSAYALTTKRDLSGMAPYLTMGLIGLIVASLVGIFVGGGLFSGLIGFAGAALFSLFLVYDVQRARSAEDTMGNAVMITVGIYLNIINLFLSLLRLLSYLQGGSRD